MLSSKQGQFGFISLYTKLKFRNCNLTKMFMFIFRFICTITHKFECPHDMPAHTRTPHIMRHPLTFPHTPQENSDESSFKNNLLCWVI